MNPSLLLAPLIAFILVVGGCAVRTTVKGKVIEGNLSFVFVVDQNDERLKTVGVQGVEVESRADVGKVAGNVLASAKSDDRGNFVMTFKDQAPLMKPVQFSGTMSGFNPARESMMIPPEDKRLLIVLKKQSDSKSPPSR
jgi:hypothetical protein